MWAKGLLERCHDYLEHSFLPGRTFASPADFNAQLADWLAVVNQRRRRALGCAPADRIAADRAAMLALPPVAPVTGWRASTRLARDHYVRLDGNDYSVHPAVIGRRIEVVADLERVRAYCDQAGHRVAFATAAQWVDRLAAAHHTGKSQSELIRLGRYPLLVVDEVGYIPFEAEAANLFFQLVSSRYERASLIVTSNKVFGRWGEVFGDDVVAAAMIDRSRPQRPGRQPSQIVLVSFHYTRACRHQARQSTTLDRACHRKQLGQPLGRQPMRLRRLTPISPGPGQGHLATDTTGTHEHRVTAPALDE